MIQCETIKIAESIEFRRSFAYRHLLSFSPRLRFDSISPEEIQRQQISRDIPQTWRNIEESRESFERKHVYQVSDLREYDTGKIRRRFQMKQLKNRNRGNYSISVNIATCPN